MAAITDNTPMPWGKYKGQKMINVPASYLLYLNTSGKCPPNMMAYINDNKEVLDEEMRRADVQLGIKN